MLKGTIMLLRIWRVLWQDGTSVRRITKVVGEPWRTYATRRVVTAWWACLAHLNIFAYPAKYATGTLKVRSVSIITKRRTPKKRTVCDSKRCCGTCGVILTRENHEYNKRFSQNCNQNKEASHLWPMRPLKNVLPACDWVLYVFYQFEVHAEHELFGYGHVTSSKSCLYTAVLFEVRGCGRRWTLLRAMRR